MARKKNTKKRRSGLLGALALLILLGVMAYKLVEVYGDLSAAKEQEARLRTQVEQKEEENNSLKDALSHADDPDYILGLARDRLGLAEDGERIFPDVKPGDHILGVYRPDGARFYQDEQLIGAIRTTGFAEAFFAIWLDARTSAPELRAALLKRG